MGLFAIATSQEGSVRVPRPPAPDIAAAVSDVVLKRADCVFAPEAAVSGKGLRRVFDAGRVPTPALVQLRAGLPKEVVAQVQKALLGTAMLGALDGFRPVNPEAYRQLRVQLRARPQRRLLMAEPQQLLTAVRSNLVPGVRAPGAAKTPAEDPQLPPLSGLLQAPLTVP